MNKSYVVLFFMCVAGIMHASQPSQQIVAASLPDWKAVDKVLQQDCEKYFLNRLEEYEKNSTVNIHELLSVGSLITGRDCSYELSRTRDVFGNYFSHVAIQKGDLPTLEWIINNTPKFNGACLNYSNQTLLDLSLNRIVSSEQDASAFKILYSTIAYTAQAINDPFKKICLEKIVSAQLEHKKHRSDLDLSLEVLRCLIPKENLEQEQLFLSTMYEQAKDENGDTFTHQFVDQELPDELFEWIKQGRVSFEKNKADMTAIELALGKLRDFTLHPALIDGDKNTFDKRRCCLFMLLNYLKMKDNLPVVPCCSKHTFEG